MEPPLINWTEVTKSLTTHGYAVIPKMLTPPQCKSLISLYNNTELYRNVIDMERYRFGKGEYKYFNYPLPAPVQSLREMMYTPLAKVANHWMTQLNINASYPEDHKEFINQCHAKNQVRPTPLILKYETGGYNTLHQDLYGEIFFPFQIILALTQSGAHYEGGELVLAELIPRAQSKAEVIQINQGDGAIITTNFRPIHGLRGCFKAKVKHGVSKVKSGTRYTLGIVFHDAA